MIQSLPRVYADFHNTDPQGRLRLDCTGTVADLATQRIELREGLRLTLYADDLDHLGSLDELLVDGTVTFSQEQQEWVAAIDWNAIRHASDDRQRVDHPEMAAAAQVVARDEWERLVLSVGSDCGVALSDKALSSEGIYE